MMEESISDPYGENTQSKFDESVIPRIENFLIYESPQKTRTRIQEIVNYLSIFLMNCFTVNQIADMHTNNLVSRVFNLFRSINPIIVDENIAKQLENIAFQCLIKEQTECTTAYIFLVEHFTTQVNNPQNLNELITWSKNKIQEAAMNVHCMNYEIVIAILDSFVELNMMAQIQNLNDYPQIFLLLASNILKYQKNAMPNGQLTRIVAKTLRLVAKLYEKSRMKSLPSITPAISSAVIEFRGLIPTAPQFSEVYQSYLLLCVSMCSENEPNIVQYVIHEVENNFYALTNPLFHSSARISRIITFFMMLLNNRSFGQQVNQLPQFFARTCAYISSVDSANELKPRMGYMIRPTVFDQLMRTNQLNYLDLMDQLVWCFNVYRMDYEMSKDNYKVEDLLRTNDTILRLLKEYLKINRVQNNGLFNYFLSSLCHELAIQLRYLLTLDERRIKQKDSIKLFTDILEKLPPVYLNYFWKCNLEILLPTDDTQLSLGELHAILLQLPKNQVYIRAFFAYISDHIETANKLTAEILLTVAGHIFFSDTIRMHIKNFSMLFLQIFSIIILIIQKKNPNLIKYFVIPFLLRIEKEMNQSSNKSYSQQKLPQPQQQPQLQMSPQQTMLTNQQGMKQGAQLNIQRNQPYANGMQQNPQIKQEMPNQQLNGMNQNQQFNRMPPQPPLQPVNRVPSNGMQQGSPMQPMNRVQQGSPMQPMNRVQQGSPMQPMNRVQQGSPMQPMNRVQQGSPMQPMNRVQQGSPMQSMNRVQQGSPMQPMNRVQQSSQMQQMGRNQQFNGMNPNQQLGRMHQPPPLQPVSRGPPNGMQQGSPMQPMNRSQQGSPMQQMNRSQQYNGMSPPPLQPVNRGQQLNGMNSYQQFNRMNQPPPLKPVGRGPPNGMQQMNMNPQFNGMQPPLQPVNRNPQMQQGMMNQMYNPMQNPRQNQMQQSPMQQNSPMQQGNYNPNFNPMQNPQMQQNRHNQPYNSMPQGSPQQQNMGSQQFNAMQQNPQMNQMQQQMGGGMNPMMQNYRNQVGYPQQQHQQPQPQNPQQQQQQQQRRLNPQEMAQTAQLTVKQKIDMFIEILVKKAMFFPLIFKTKNIDIETSKMALIFYPLFTKTPKFLSSTNEWFALFFPTLEKCTEDISPYLGALYSALKTDINSVFEALRPQLTETFIRCISNILARKKNESERDYARYILRRIPEKFIKVATKIPHTLSQYTFATYNGVKVPVDPFLQQFKEGGATEEQYMFLFSCFVDIINTKSFFECATSKLLHQIVEFIPEKLEGRESFRKEVFANLKSRVTPESFYSTIFFEECVFHNINENIEAVENKEDFIENLSLLCNNERSAKTMISLLSCALRYIPICYQFYQATVSLLQACTFDKEAALTVLKESVLTRDFKVQNDLERSIFNEIIKTLVLMSKQMKSSQTISAANECLCILFKTREYREKIAMFIRSIKFIDSFIRFSNNPQKVLCYNFMFSHNAKDLLGPSTNIFFDKIMQELRNIKFEYFNLPTKCIKRLEQGDKDVCNFLCVRYFIKIFAWVSSSETDQNLALQFWSASIDLLKEKQYYRFIQYFTRKVKSFINKGIGSLQWFPKGRAVFAPTEKGSFEFEQFFFFDLLLEYNALDNSCYSYVATRLSQFFHSPNHKISKKYLSLFFKIFSRLPHTNDTCQMIKLLFEWTLSFLADSNYMPPLGIALSQLQKETVDEVINHIQNRWQPGLFDIIEILFNEPDFGIFRKELITRIYEKTDIMKKALSDSVKSYSDNGQGNKEFSATRLFTALMGRSLNTLSKAVSPKFCTEEILYKSQIITQNILRDLIKDPQYHTVLFNTVFFAPAVKILLPIEVKDIIVHSSRIKESMIELVQFFVQNYHFFSHHLFFTRFAELYNILRTETEVDIIEILNSVNCLNGQSKLFQAWLRFETLNKYPPFNPTTFTANFSNFMQSESPIADLLIREYCSLLHIVDNIDVTDFIYCSIETISANIHATAIMKGEMNVMSIFSISRLLKVAEFMKKTKKNITNFKGDLTKSFSILIPKVPATSVSIRIKMKSAGTSPAFYSTDPEFITSMVRLITINAFSVKEELPVIWIFQLPEIVESLIKADNYQANTRIFDALVKLTLDIMGKQEPNSMRYLKNFPEALKEARKGVSANCVNQEHFNMIKIAFEQDLKNRSYHDFIIMLKLIDSMSSVLFDAYQNQKEIKFYPSVLSGNIFLKNTSREVFELYHNALKSAIEFGGRNIGSRAISEIYKAMEVTINTSFSPPQASPFASVVQWITDFDGNKLWHENMKLLFKCVIPANIFDLYTNLISLKQPVHPYVIQEIHKIIENENPRLASLCSSSAKSVIFVYKKFDNIAEICWNNDWFSQEPETHIQIFALLFLPYTISLTSLFFDINVLQATLVTGLNAMILDKSMRKFMHYYTGLFPKSSLSAVFLATTEFSDLPPMPFRGIYSSMLYLEKLNLSDDALGLVKVCSPKLMTAASFSQLCQYEAAMGVYTNVAEEDEDSYANAMLQIRAASINLSFPSKQDICSSVLIKKNENSPNYIPLPFSTYFSSTKSNDRFPITTFFSSSFLVLISRSVIAEEAINSLSSNLRMQTRTQSPQFPQIAMQQPQMSDNEQRLWKNIWLPSLDRSCATSSSLGWRITVLKNMLKELPQETHIKDLLMSDLSAYAHLLADVGSLRRALPVLLESENYGDNKFIGIKRPSIPRVQKFLEKAMSQKINFRHLSFEFFFQMKDFRQAIEQLLTTPEQFRINIHAWVKLMIFYVTHNPRAINVKDLESRIASVFDITDKEDTSLLIAFLMVMIRYNPKVALIFLNKIASKDHQMDKSPLQFLAWTKWIPLLLSIYKDTSLSIFELFKRFRKCHLGAYLYELKCLYPNVEIESSLNGVILNFSRIFSWTNECTKDIERLTLAVRARKHFYELLESSTNQNDRELFAQLGIETKQDLAKYCFMNPTYFITREKIKPLPAESNTQFPVRETPINVFHSIIKADGKKEAEISFISYKGEKFNFSIVSPEKYPFSQEEYAFFDSISRIIASHPSVKTRIPFINYPSSIRIHKDLLVVSTLPFTGLHDLISDEHVINGIKQGARKLFNQPNDDPNSCVTRRTLEFPKNLLYKWFMDGSDGSLNNFLVLRNSFASNLAANFALRLEFMSSLPTMPTIAIFRDRVQAAIPGLFIKAKSFDPLPFTQQITGFLPSFVLHGSFTTAFCATLQSLNDNKEEAYLYTLASTGMIEYARMLAANLSRTAPIITEDTDKYDDPFTFALVQHLIETGNNTFLSQYKGFAWI